MRARRHRRWRRHSGKGGVGAATDLALASLVAGMGSLLEPESPIPDGGRIELETVHREEDAVSVQLRGDLAGRLWTEEVKEFLEEHYVDDGVRSIRLDLSQVRFLDNFGVATIVALMRHSRQRGKRFLIQGARGQVREKLQVTGLLGILQQGT